ncbi:MAG TPA: gamma carbonic anhydrase family protein [Hydrogenophaga sp.]|uniref:gamma carbonic anhydrase family protein n=1 Tax=Hydrogenophaga sp. TaxID=1904254 RepID=UPI002C8778F3|nr:gamma carbonic anhydrase family protein [Hydrogenophaga sp.]HSX95542.1 gamma carbonic anhydrase family protein [Hydrogenophaga sp.]
MPYYQIQNKQPQVDSSAFVAPDATLVGDVQVDAQASVWFHAVARGDNEPIRIGTGSNVQEGAVLHADPGYPLVIGRNVTVGHQAMLHGCTIGDGSLIGIQAVVLNGARIGRECLVGAGAVVTERKEFPDRSLVLGAPAKVARPLTDAEVANLHASAQGYAERAARLRAELQRVGD